MGNRPAEGCRFLALSLIVIETSQSGRSQVVLAVRRGLSRALPTALLASTALLTLAGATQPFSGQPARELVGDLAQTSAALLAAVLCLRARGRDPQTERAWRWAALAATSWAAGNVALIVLAFGLDQHARPGVGDLFFVVSSISAVVAALSFPSAPRAVASRFRILLDGAITGSALFFFGWVLLDAVLPPSVGGAEVVQAGYPVVDMVIVVAVMAAASRLPSRQRLPLLTVGLGVVGLAASNVATYILDSRGVYTPGDRLDLGLVAGLAVIGLGAALQRPQDRPRAASQGLSRFQLMLPFLPVCAAVGIGVMQNDELSVAQLVLGSTMAAFVVLRQLLLVMENDTLLAEMARRARRVEAIIDGSSDLTLLLDADGSISWASPSFARHFTDPASVLGRPLGELLPHSDVVPALRDAVGTGRAVLDVTWMDLNGAACEYELHLTSRLDDPLLNALVVQARDVTARRAAEAALAVSEERYRRIVEASSDGIWLVDANAVTRFVNTRAAELAGLRVEDILDKPVLEVVAPFLDEMQRAMTEQRVAERRRGGDKYELKVHRPDGTEAYLWVSATPLYDEGGTYEGSLTMITDITTRKQLEDELLLQATTDALTGLANRDTFLSSAAAVLGGSRRGSQAAVLFCDLDGFKAVNDTFGHSIGDELLRVVAMRLRHCLSERDVLARLGGDEFAALLIDVNDEYAATVVAERLLSVLGQPVRVGGRTLHVSGSIGIALAEPGKDVEQLLREADLAMYEAKGAGRGRSQVFAPSMHAALLHRMAIDLELREALTRQQFALDYQPIIKLDSGGVAGFEALLRWQHPTRGWVKPDEFIPASEESGLIVPLGAWVIDEACRQAATWLACGLELQMGVNVAAPQLEAGTLPGIVREALNRHGLPPGKLVLEITERALLAGEAATAALIELDSMGVHLALDDFGTGHSSLSHLRDFPVHIVKMDRSYVTRLAQNERDARLAKGLVDMAHGLGLDVVAEGIETLEQESAVRALGCRLVQGFRYAPGMPGSEATAWAGSPRLRRLPTPRSQADADVLEANE
jgi:diguanylate cyclase (GGDEF)-like protein/PAS domain S-box-containing protein